MTGSAVTVTVPLSVFTGANLNAISALVFGSFTKGAWTLGSMQFVCGTKAPATTSVVTPTAATTPVATPPVVTPTPATTSIVTPPVVTPSAATTANPVVTTTTVATPSAAPGTCTNLLIDDWASQSRLTFLFYNAMMEPSSDDGSMQAVTGRVDTGSSVIVSNNRVTLTPKTDGSSYFYSQFDCVKATNIYGGIGLTISAPAGTVITVELQTSKSCDTNNAVSIDVTSTQLGWTFNGAENFYTIPFSKFTGLDQDHLVSVLFGGFKKAVVLGPMAFYCGTTGSKYPDPSTVAVVQPSSTIPATAGPSAYVIDTFANANSNSLGFYHGGDDNTLMKIASGKLTINTKGNADLSWYTQIVDGCKDLTPNDNGYVHIAFTGSNAFTIALQQHNPTCNETLSPYPYTWDSVEASRYSNSAKTDIYVPVSHFNINRKVAIGFALKGFYTSTATVVSKIELVKTVPSGFLVPSKLDSAPLVFACTRPNSFAFAIDDGAPLLAQQVIKTLKAANILATFFTVGAPLLDASTNLTNVYKEMLSLGHQVAYHSYTHPPMEGLQSLAAIDWELDQDIAAVQKTLGITSKYFRPPFGTEGARVRQRLAARIPGAKFVAWSVDVADWLYAESSTPQKQVTNFQSDVNKGGNLVSLDHLPSFHFRLWRYRDRAVLTRSNRLCAIICTSLRWITSRNLLILRRRLESRL